MIVLRAGRRWPCVLGWPAGRVEVEACPPRRSGTFVAAPSDSAQTGGNAGRDSGSDYRRGPAPSHRAVGHPQRLLGAEHQFVLSVFSIAMKAAHLSCAALPRVVFKAARRVSALSCWLLVIHPFRLLAVGAQAPRILQCRITRGQFGSGLASTLWAVVEAMPACRNSGSVVRRRWRRTGPIRRRSISQRRVPGSHKPPALRISGSNSCGQRTATIAPSVPNSTGPMRAGMATRPATLAGAAPDGRVPVAHHRPA